MWMYSLCCRLEDISIQKGQQATEKGTRQATIVNSPLDYWKLKWKQWKKAGTKGRNQAHGQFSHLVSKLQNKAKAWQRKWTLIKLRPVKSHFDSFLHVLSIACHFQRFYHFSCISFFFNGTFYIQLWFCFKRYLILNFLNNFIKEILLVFLRNWTKSSIKNISSSWVFQTSIFF